MKEEDVSILEMKLAHNAYVHSREYQNEIGYDLATMRILLRDDEEQGLKGVTFDTGANKISII